jgi:hypothetical protein
MNDLLPLTDDEAALVYHIGRFGSDGYPIERVGRRWQWRSWRSVGGAPIAYRTKQLAVAAFEAWYDLALERWRRMRVAGPYAILTAVGVVTPGMQS